MLLHLLSVGDGWCRAEELPKTRTFMWQDGAGGGEREMVYGWWLLWLPQLGSRGLNSSLHKDLDVGSRL